jgi:hypothetical protein
MQFDQQYPDIDALRMCFLFWAMLSLPIFLSLDSEFSDIRQQCAVGVLIIGDILQAKFKVPDPS